MCILIISNFVVSVLQWTYLCNKFLNKYHFKYSQRTWKLFGKIAVDEAQTKALFEMLSGVESRWQSRRTWSSYLTTRAQLAPWVLVGVLRHQKGQKEPQCNWIGHGREAGERRRGGRTRLCPRRVPRGGERFLCLEGSTPCGGISRDGEKP